MARLVYKKEFRCTAEEAAWISACAKYMNMTESNYMRYQLRKKKKIRLPEEIDKLLKELKYYEIKIGTNINQIARLCNIKRFVTKEDYKALVEYLLMIDQKHEEILEKLQEILKYGGDKTSEDKGDCR